MHKPIHFALKYSHHTKVHRWINPLGSTTRKANYAYEKVSVMRKPRSLIPKHTNQMPHDNVHFMDSFTEEELSVANERDVDDFFLEPSVDIQESHFSFISTIKEMMKQRERESLEIEERQNELEAREKAIRKYHESVSGAARRNQGASLTPSQQILKEWLPPLIKELKRIQKDVHSGKDAELISEGLKNDIAQYVTLINAEKMAIISCSTLLSGCLGQLKPIFSEVSRSIGETISAEYYYSKLSKDRVVRNLGKDSRLPKKLNSIAKLKVSEEEACDEVSMTKLGAYLLSLIFRVAKVPTVNSVKGTVEDIAAFTHEVEIRNDHRLGVIKVASEIRQIIDTSHAFKETCDIKAYPMITRPAPWQSFNDGGYLLEENKTLVMRTKGSLLQSFVLEDALLDEVLDALNVLGDTQWAINERILEVVETVWKSGGGLAQLPSRTDEPIPPKPSSEEPQEIYRWKKKKAKIQQHNRDLHSLRCDMKYKLEVAHKFRTRVLYFPHTIDFRGRAYPIPPHLNHLGSDINRGFLFFSTSKPITEKGIFWLKIHLANLNGMDKLSFDERIQYIEMNIENIMDSADHPLDGKKWWLTSENPWQCLAACIELTSCLRHPKPEQFESRLPIQMDGSCNGLQHYAALGRDNLGALHVNLLPTEKPMDVYNGVLSVVIKNLESDAKVGNKYAKELLGKVYRSTIKQTVMTSVYGVTFVGARQQIEKRLKEKKEVNEDMVYPCACYLASTTLKSLGEVFRGAKAIMDWLNECALLISSKGYPVMWVTPLGLPVVQPYRTPRRSQIKTLMQNISLVDRKDQLPVNKQRQKSAFPPNYVHSLDASHMFLTARACKEKGIEFASVHDSYWSHGADIEMMNEIIREQFVYLHSQPLLETLYSSFKQLHPDVDFPPVPKKGSLDLQRLRKAKYFFD